jgi:hypothetical protein
MKTLRSYRWNVLLNAKKKIEHELLGELKEFQYRLIEKDANYLIANLIRM